MWMRSSEPGDKWNGKLSFRLDSPTSIIRACTALRGFGLRTSTTVSPLQAMRLSFRRSMRPKWTLRDDVDIAIDFSATQPTNARRRKRSGKHLGWGEVYAALR